MKFVKACVEDLNELIAFEKTVFKRPEDQFNKRVLRHLMVSPTSLTLLVRDDDGRLIGEVIGLIRNFKVPSGRVYKIGVAGDIRHKGLGTTLLLEIENWFKKMGMKKTTAEVREGNKPSRRMFEKNGYSETDYLPFYYANGEAAIKYWKSF
ncbi:MAG: GNAT family N-acetyltransferase [Candidatus Rifleibacteriota bacterium]